MCVYSMKWICIPCMYALDGICKACWWRINHGQMNNNLYGKPMDAPKSYSIQDCPGDIE